MQDSFTSASQPACSRAGKRPFQTRQLFSPALPDAGTVACASQVGVVLFQEAGNGVTRFQRYDKNYEKLFQEQVRQYNRSKSERMQEENLQLNVIQRSMFRRVMYGIKDFPGEEIAALSTGQIDKIVSDHKKCTETLHRLKVLKYYRGATELINACFPHIKLGTKFSDFLVELPKSETLRVLGISTRDVVNSLIQAHLLPVNFFELSVNDLRLA